MSLSNVILTVLSTHDATGYDITKKFSYNLGHFWKSFHQQVYLQLNKMVNNNLVTYRLEPQEGRPNRKIYSITDLGRRSLFEWFQEPTRNPTIRDELSAKLLVCGIHNSEPLQQHIKALIEESHTQLNHDRDLEQTLFANYKEQERQVRLERLALRRAIHNRQAWSNWAEEVQAELKEIDSSERSCMVVQ